MTTKIFKNPLSETMSTEASRRDTDMIVVGELNLDLILDQVNALPGLEKEIICQQMNLTIGSSSAIMALNAASLGLKVKFVGKIGDDDFGKTCIGALKNRSIDVDSIITSDSGNTGLTCIYTQGRKRGMITYPGTMDTFTFDEIPTNILNSAKHLHLSSYYLQRGLKPDVPKLFKLAKESGMTTSFDTNFDPDEVWGSEVFDVLQHVDIFFPNDTEAMNITHTNTVEDAISVLSKYCALVVVTCGSKGVIGQFGDTIFTADGLKIETKDAVGAGDTFNSGFLSLFLKGADIEACVTSGIQASAFSTTYVGGIEAFNHLDSYTRFCASNPVNFTIQVLENK
jgi:sugar/nucleoside kinase (ribokinase family)